MPLLAESFTELRLCTDFASLKHASPKGVYVAPVPEEPLLWTGVLFVRKGPYTKATLRFRIAFPINYPESPPVVTFVSDIFHPLVAPLTTYTYTTRDTGAAPVSAAGGQILPPGGLSLRHGFPEWFGIKEAQTEQAVKDGGGLSGQAAAVQLGLQGAGSTGRRQMPHVVEVLQYMHIIFDTEAVLDSIPLDAAANSGAWHAWNSFRSKVVGGRASPARQVGGDASETASEHSLSPRQHPGGARRPGEWNWQGVWEERVKKSIKASNSDAALFGAGEASDMVNFVSMEPDALKEALSAC